MKQVILFLAVVAIIIIFIAKTHNKGDLSYWLVHQKTIWEYAKEHNIEIKTRVIPPSYAVINTDTVEYHAATSDTSEATKEQYKYFHLIGYGKLLGINQYNYLWRVNSKYGFITTDELIAQWIKLKQEGKIK